MIDSLHIAGFKLFRDLTLPKLGRMNLFVGENNTGKSCLLEAIGLYAGRNPVADILQVVAQRSTEPLSPWEKAGLNDEGTVLRHLIFDLFHRDEAGGQNRDSGDFLIEKVNDTNSLRISHMPLGYTTNEAGLRSYLPPKGDAFDFGPSEQVIFASRGDFMAPQIGLEFFSNRATSQSSGSPLFDRAPLVPYLPANGFSDGMAASLWDGLIQGPGQDRVLSCLRMIDARIEDLDYIAGQINSRVALLKVEGKGRIPLSTMGDGLRRMFHIGLAMATASKGILLIDEFENGLHWRVQRELWAALGKAAKEFDVQIFATTHSRDCIQGFVSASQEAGIPDAKMYRLEREGDEIYAVDLALINVEAALELNGEMR
jgi:predicted ATPase